MNAGPPEGERRLHAAAFARCHRLTKTDEFSSVFSFRKAFRSTHFLLHYRPRGGDKAMGARLGLVIAKRYLPRSVDRNLIRRLARESFRTIRPRLQPCDMILRLATKPGRPLDRRAVVKEIQGLLEKLISTSFGQ